MQKMTSGLRIMQETDLQQVNSLLSRAFTQGRFEDGYAQTDVPMLRHEFIRMYLGQRPQGCFVYVESGKIVGAAFCHVWGKVGWFGPLAVAPERHLMGIGKNLVSACIGHLKSSGCTTIGLETNPRSARNLGFYGRLSFFPERLSVDMIRPTPTADNETSVRPHLTFPYSSLSDEDRREFRLHVRNLQQWADLDADYEALIEDARRYGVGDTLLFIRGSTPIGFAVLQTVPSLVDEQNNVLRLIAFVAHPKTPEAYVPYFLADLIDYARRGRFDRILLRVPLYNDRFFRLLLDNNYRVVNSDVRLTLSGFGERTAKLLHINRWV